MKASLLPHPQTRSACGSCSIPESLYPWGSPWGSGQARRELIPLQREAPQPLPAAPLCCSPLCSGSRRFACTTLPGAWSGAPWRCCRRPKPNSSAARYGHRKHPHESRLAGCLAAGAGAPQLCAPSPHHRHTPRLCLHRASFSAFWGMLSLNKHINLFLSAPQSLCSDSQARLGG